MKIDIIKDIVPPIVVAGVDIAASKSTQTIMGQPLQRVLNWVMTGGGYLAYAMGWGGGYSEFLKNIAIASAPATWMGLYTAITGATSGAASRVMRRVSRYPGPAAESPFQGVKLI